MSQLEVQQNALISEKILFIDGLTRVGKSMMNRLLAALDDVSHPMFLNPLEQLIPMCSAGLMDSQAAASYLKIYLNESHYNYHLSRNLNFRYGDLTSIHNARDPRQFYHNLSCDDGDAVVEKTACSGVWFQYQTHDVLTHYSWFLQLDLPVRVLELFRHPVDTVHSWYKRGWGERFDQADPRAFTTLFNYQGKTIPHYVIGCEEDYLPLNPMEKCVFMHNRLVKESIKEFKKLDLQQREQFLLIKFEDVLEQPDLQLERICQFLGATKTPLLANAMAEARVPRPEYQIAPQWKLDEIKDAVNPQLLEELLELADDYQQHFFGLE